jgi:nitroreductase
VFVVVRDQTRREALADITRRLWRDHGREHAAAHVGQSLLREIDVATDIGFGGAPVLVVVAADTSAFAGASRGALGSSIYPAVQNLLLAAAALGYGSALTTLATVTAAEVRAVVELPDGIEPMAIVPVGRPSRALAPPRRAPVETKAHREHYGAPFVP